MLLELIFASLMNAVNLAMLIDETRRRAKRSIPELKTPRGSIVFRQTMTLGKFATYFTRGVAGDSRLTLDYCAELVTNAFRLTPSARRRDAPEDKPRRRSTAALSLQRALETRSGSD